jgi:hypothetical protein
MTAPAAAPTNSSETSPLPEITDDEMRELLGTSKPYTAMLLLLTENAKAPDAREIIYEHGRRNAALRAAGKLPIICRSTDDTDWAGICIFDATPDEVERIMAGDPAVNAGLLTYELHPVSGFPGSSLP